MNKSIYSTLESTAVGLTAIIVLLLTITFSAAAQSYGPLPDYATEQGLSRLNSENIFQIRLLGITNYESNEIFHAILSRTSGVIEAKQYFVQMIPDTPQACWTTWQVEVNGIDGFELQSRVYRNLQHYLAKEDVRHSELSLPFTILTKDLDLLRDVLPISLTSKQITFAAISAIPALDYNCANAYKNGPFDCLPTKGFE